MSRLPDEIRAGAALFDLDGVLADSFDAWLEVIGECRERRRLPRIPAREVRARFGQGIAADCRTFFPGTDPRELAREYDQRFARHAGRVRPMPGARPLVRRLAGERRPLAVVTNSPLALARQILRGFGILDAFDAVCGGDEVARGKPDPALVRLALGRLGAPPSRAFLVGDTRLDVEAARAAGVFAVGLGVEADLRVERLEDLAALLPPV